jgi:hypothetical protein
VATVPAFVIVGQSGNVAEIDNLRAWIAAERQRCKSFKAATVRANGVVCHAIE